MNLLFAFATGVLVLSLGITMNLDNVSADANHAYRQGYLDGNNGNEAKAETGDYYRGYLQGTFDLVYRSLTYSDVDYPDLADNVGSSSNSAAASGVFTDPDPDEKSGGKDPLVFGGWDYHVNNAEKCETPNKFDYDNDGFVENFCYEVLGSIFVIDLNNNGNIDNGAEMLNFYRTPLEGHTPITFMQEYGDVCEQYDCYLWHDSVGNWSVDEYELIPFSFDVDYVRYFPEGKQLVENGKYAYCSGESVNGEKFYCIQPTYWQKGIIE